MANKMTRKEALELGIAHFEQMYQDYVNTSEPDEISEEYQNVIEVYRKMVASIEKQNNRPKSKTSARIQNENSAKLLIGKLMETHHTEPINATWIAENIPYVMTSQRGYHVAKIAREWGALEEVTIKKRTYYILNENYSPEE